jgi:DNA-binding transcriptional LysR family regulator
MAGRLDSRALTLFVAVAHSLNFRQAAQALHLSQPPLSRAIRQLEERLGTRLFERDTQRVALTPAGRLLLPRAQQILALLAQAEAAVTALDKGARLRIGLTSAIEPSWFAGLADRIARVRPGAAVATLSDTSPRLVRALRTHRLDAAFIALPTESDGLDVTLLEAQPMVVAMASTHPLSRRRRVPLAALDGQRVFMFERARQPAFFDHCQAVLAQHRVAIDAVREPADHPVLLAEVAAGRALALLPRSFTALRRAGVSYRPLVEGEALAVGVGLALHPGNAPLRETLRRCAVAER